MPLKLDPRTKFFMILVVSSIVMISATTPLLWVLRITMTLIPIVLLIAEKKYSSAIRFAVLYVAALLITFFVISEKSTGMVASILTGYTGIVVQFMPSFITAWYVIRTTNTDEFMAAMQKMHVPDGITISLAVVMRLFPTIKEEYASIQAAMKMRGIMLGGGNVGKMVEYRMIPLLFSCVNIGDELSAAAVTRGLGGKVRRTSVVELKLTTADYILMGLFAVSAVLFVYFKYFAR